MIYTQNYNKKKIKKVFFIILFFIIASIIFSLFLIINKNINKDSINKNMTILYKKMFKEKNFLELIGKMDSELKKNPFNQEFLIYRGYAYFLLGEDEGELLKREKFFVSSLIDLRKALAIGINKNNMSNIYFCIGKLYYYMGESYYYQSIAFLKKSLELGNKRKDLFYTIGIVYSYIGDYKESTKYFFEALKIEESELTLLAIANSFYKQNDYQNAKIYIQKVMNISNDPKINEKAYFLMGEILFSENNSTEALDYFNKVIQINENNALAYFYRGEIYYTNKDLIRARAEWRKTLDIDPSHILAKKRLY